ncbi:hypothetical protein [Winogradskyella haliclonae]|nr:hypothetical protein [Winogradskyella haliclonae]
MKTSKLFIVAIFCLTLIISCSDDDDNPAPVNPTELFTNVTLTFTPSNGANATVVMEDIQPNGQGGGGATSNTVTGAFVSGETYTLTLAATDASDPNDVDDLLNDDVIPEADEHFFVYGLNTLNFTMTRDANDVVGLDGNKIGVNTTWVAGAASTGNLSITLVHEATAVDEAANNNLGSATGGEEDFNITFTNVSIN